MGWDFVKRKSTGRDFARGEPPPADSIEWAGIPQSAANVMAQGRSSKKPVTKAAVGAEPERDGKGSKALVLVTMGFVVGLITGSWGRRD